MKEFLENIFLHFIVLSKKIYCYVKVRGYINILKLSLSLVVSPSIFSWQVSIQSNFLITIANIVDKLGFSSYIG